MRVSRETGRGGRSRTVTKDTREAAGRRTAQLSSSGGGGDNPIDRVPLITDWRRREALLSVNTPCRPFPRGITLPPCPLIFVLKNYCKQVEFDLVGPVTAARPEWTKARETSDAPSARRLLVGISQDSPLFPCRFPEKKAALLSHKSRSQFLFILPNGLNGRCQSYGYLPPLVPAEEGCTKGKSLPPFSLA